MIFKQKQNVVHQTTQQTPHQTQPQHIFWQALKIFTAFFDNNKKNVEHFLVIRSIFASRN